MRYRIAKGCLDHPWPSSGDGKPIVATGSLERCGVAYSGCGHRVGEYHSCPCSGLREHWWKSGFLFGLEEWKFFCRMFGCGASLCGTAVPIWA